MLHKEGADASRDSQRSESYEPHCRIPTKCFDSVCRAARLEREKSYFAYLRKRLMTASLYSSWMRVLSYFRRLRLISIIVRILSSVIAVLGTGAVFLVITGSVILLIPFVITVFTFFYLWAVALRGRDFSRLRDAVGDKPIYVLFPHSRQSFERGSFFEQTVDIISNDTKNQNFIIIISPYFFSGKSVARGARHRYYQVLRFESDNVCTVRRSSFYDLKKKILSASSDRVTYMY